MGAATVGIVLGAILVIPAAPWLRPLLYQTSLRDPVVMAAVATLILVVALAACMIPARQATRIPPASSPPESLRVVDLGRAGFGSRPRNSPRFDAV